MRSCRPTKRDDDVQAVSALELPCAEISMGAGSLDSTAKRAAVLALLTQINMGD